MEALRQRGEISTIAVRETSEMERAFPPPSGAQENGHDPKATLRTALRRFFHGLRKTPLHPQWIVTRREEKHLQEIAGFLRGWVLDVGSGDRRLENYLPPQIRYIAVDYPPQRTALSQPAPHLGRRDAPTVSQRDNGQPGPAGSPRASSRRAGGDKRSSPCTEIRRTCGCNPPLFYPIHDAPFDFGRITQYLIERLASDAGL